jgi:hypothetical protein
VPTANVMSDSSSHPDHDFEVPVSIVPVSPLQFCCSGEGRFIKTVGRQTMSWMCRERAGDFGPALPGVQPVCTGSWPERCSPGLPDAVRKRSGRK